MLHVTNVVKHRNIDMKTKIIIPLDTWIPCRSNPATLEMWPSKTGYGEPVPQEMDVEDALELLAKSVRMQKSLEKGIANLSKILKDQEVL